MLCVADYATCCADVCVRTCLGIWLLVTSVCVHGYSYLCGCVVVWVTRNTTNVTYVTRCCVMVTGYSVGKDFFFVSML